MEKSHFQLMERKFTNLSHNSVLGASFAVGLVGAAAIAGGFGMMFYHPVEGLGLLLGGYAATGLAIGAVAYHSLLNRDRVPAPRRAKD